LVGGFACASGTAVKGCVSTRIRHSVVAFKTSPPVLPTKRLIRAIFRARCFSEDILFGLLEFSGRLFGHRDFVGKFFFLGRGNQKPICIGGLITRGKMLVKGFRPTVGLGAGKSPKATVFWVFLQGVSKFPPPPPTRGGNRS